MPDLMVSRQSKRAAPLAQAGSASPTKAKHTTIRCGILLHNRVFSKMQYLSDTTKPLAAQKTKTYLRIPNLEIVLLIIRSSAQEKHQFLHYSVGWARDADVVVNALLLLPGLYRKAGYN